MASQEISAPRRTDFNLTTASTLHHLVAVGAACAGLWMIIIATIGA